MSLSLKEVTETRKLFVMLALAAAFVLGSASTLAIQQYTQRIENKAAVKVVGVGIYQDLNFTVSVTEIDWGILEPGESRNVSAYILNESNVPLTLSMASLDWQPANASDYMTLSWNQEAAVLPVGGYVDATFTLTLSLATPPFRNFSFVIIVIGRG